MASIHEIKKWQKSRDPTPLICFIINSKEITVLCIKFIVMRSNMKIQVIKLCPRDVRDCAQFGSALRLIQRCLSYSKPESVRKNICHCP